MSTNNDNIITCANCGKGEENSGDLKACTACKMVKYCNRDCQIAHRPHHKKACKKRAKELHDKALFKQPPPNEDCPICMLPLPEMETGKKYKTCCGKMMCSGCIHAVELRDGGVSLCPFCRTPAPPSPEEMIKLIKKRMELGDAKAIYNLGCYYNNGHNGLPQNRAKALELNIRAAKLGCAASYYNIGNAYCFGIGVERDIKKAYHYFELAAMGGDAQARNNLGCLEASAGNVDRALKHLMIAAGGGIKLSLNMIQDMFKNGGATKKDYTQALRAYQAYLGEIKSPQRDEAATFNEQYYKYC
jgi:TPR repeat protein